MDQSLIDRIKEMERTGLYDVASGMHPLSFYSIVLQNQKMIMEALVKQEEEWEAFKEERFLSQIK